jgi:hemerythrin superfamily protein
MQDHREVEQLFAQYKTSRDPNVVMEICTELTVHTAVEEKVVYPALASGVDGGKGLREHSEHEHDEVKQAIIGIERVGYANSQVDVFMQQIIEGVTEHVQEEENEVFPKMRQQLGPEKLERLGEQVAQTKKQLLAEAKQAGPLIDLTKAELLDLASAKQIQGRSSMSKEQLISALRSQG